MMDDFKNNLNFIIGRSGEKIVAKELIRRGWWILPSYDYSGEDGSKAPKLHGSSSSLVIPDLDVMNGTTRRWVEVKTKTSATLTYTANRLDHGIDLRHWNSYLQVKKLSKSEVWLAVYELDTCDVLIQDTALLESKSRKHRFTQGNQLREMIYFPRSEFLLLFNTKSPS